MNSKEAKNIIRNHCKSIGLNSNAKGYVKDNETNLIQIFDNWDEIKAELGSGQGSELKKDKNGIVKFNALHSSSALCVNNFAPLKANLGSLTFLSSTNFTEGSFEKKLQTGISTPNLDFYLESEFEIIGFESKYLEFLDKKHPDDNHNLTQYIKRKSELSYMPDDYFILIEDYIKLSNKMHFDVAQLIKHTIGLKKKTFSKYKFIFNSLFVRPTLVYIYWQPNNWFNIDEYCKHEEEIKSFKEKIDKYINFVPISYIEFWKYYESDKIYSDHIKNIKVRYDISF